MSNFTDDRNVPIKLGDTVSVGFIDRSRGAEMWMDQGVVVGFGWTRVKVKFPSRTEPCSVGAECLRVIP